MTTPLLAAFDLIALAASVGKIVFLTFLVILPLVSISVYFERRISAVIQDRVGPNRVGVPLTLLGFKKDWQPFGIGGLAQAAADGLKFILKEDFVPAHVRTFYYWLAPCLTMVPALRDRIPGSTAWISASGQNTFTSNWLRASGRLTSSMAPTM